MVFPIENSGRPNLREMKIDHILESHGLNREWWNSRPPDHQNWEIANIGMGSAFGIIHAARDPNNPYREHDAKTLQWEAQELYGFPTVDDYVNALVELRDELREQLAPDVWKTFFGTTLDITKTER